MSTKKLFALFCILGFLLLALTLVSAQQKASKTPPTNTGKATTPEETSEEEEEEEEKKIVLLPSPNVQTAYVFPKFPERRFPSGERVDVLLGLINTGDKPFNITLLTGHLVNPVDYSYFVENYTRYDFYGRHLQINPNEQVSILYVFKPDPVLEPREFGLTLNVFYNDGVTNYSSAYYNSTIEIIEQPSRFDSETLFTYFAITAILGLVGFVGYRSLPARWMKKQKFSGKLDVSGRSSADDDDWLPADLKKRNVKSPRSPNKVKSS